MHTQDRKPSWYGPVMILLSGIAWSFSGVLSKGLMWSGFSKAGVRGVIAVIIYGIFRKSFKVKTTPGLLVGALGVSATSLMYLLALMNTTSANAIVLQYSMPVYVVLISWIMFRQRPRRRDVIAVAFVLMGVILCCINSGGNEKVVNKPLGDMFALLSALTFAIVYIASRFPGCDPVSYTYLGNLFSAFMVFAIFLDPNVHFVPEDGITWAMIAEDWLRILLLGLSLGFGYLFFGYGMRFTPPITAAIISNAEPVLNPVWVFLFLGEFPGVLSVVGAVIVLVTATVHSCLPHRQG